MTTARQLVVVVHGFGGKRIWMQPLSYRLRQHYTVVNWTYLSFAGSVESHSKRFLQFLKQLDHEGPINIVAHSMGSIVTRAALQSGSIPNLNRIVMLAPPNSGSPAAQVLGHVFGWACRPIKDLSSAKHSFVNSLPATTPCETGVVAAKYDVLVPVESTRMATLKDHVTITGTHNSLLFSSHVSRMVIQFLQHGHFSQIENLQETLE